MGIGCDFQRVCGQRPKVRPFSLPRPLTGPALAGDYVRRWVPELADTAEVHKLTAGRPAGYPEPMVDHSAERAEALRRYGLIR